MVEVTAERVTSDLAQRRSVLAAAQAAAARSGQSGRTTEVRALRGISHVAMSVPVGTLTDEFRAELLRSYGGFFGWRELESLRRADRLTIAVGGGDYVNVRERVRSAEYSGYEHFGLRLPSAQAVEAAWAALAADGRCAELDPLGVGEDTYRRFRYLLPMGVEMQHLSGEGT
jgi:hypothetical protein